MKLARTLTRIRANEKRDVWGAFFVLLGFVGSHQLLETARDALFLSRIPASRLPWVYLGIAAFALVATQLQHRYVRDLRPRVAVVGWLSLAAIVTLGFWLARDYLGEGGLYGLYIWSGVVATLVLVHFWTLLAETFSITQAKRLYGLIGAGSVAGAIIGSGAASLLTRYFPGEHLVVVAAGGFGLTALAALCLSTPARAADASPSSAGFIDSARLVLEDGYAKRLTALMLVVAATVTVADYIFKSVIAETVPAAELAPTLAAIYFVLNIASLGSQLFLVSFMLKRFDVHAALSLLPILLALGGLAVLTAGGLTAALLIKGADGTLRYSLHKTSAELLFIPIAESTRARVKSFIDVVGQRGGQALASLGILGVAALDLPLTVSALILVILAGLWFGGVLDLRGHYLDIFRRRLRAGDVSASAFPELDLASLETLVSAMGSDNSAEVIAALDVLEREGKARLVPAFILYHPARAVVLRALGMFASAGRVGAVHIVDRLLYHDDPTVRAAAVATRSVLAPDRELLEATFDRDDSAEVRAAVIVNLIVGGHLTEAEVVGNIEAILELGPVSGRRALAAAIGRLGAPGFEAALIRLCDDPELEVRLEALEAMGAVGAPEFLPHIVQLLGDEATRRRASAVLQSFGEAALFVLSDALRDPKTPEVVRWVLPRVLVDVVPDRAAATLLDNLPDETSGMVRYRTLVALERLQRRDPGLRLDAAALERAISSNVSRALRYLDRRVCLLRGAAAQPERVTEGHKLIVRMLHDKERNAAGRLFRLLDLAHRKESFAHIWRGLQSSRASTRGSSMELLENILAPPLRDAVVALFDDAPDMERLDRGRFYHQPMGLEYEAVLEQMLASSSETVQVLTAYHVGELGLVRFRERIVELRSRGFEPADFNLTLSRLAEKEATRAG